MTKEWQAYFAAITAITDRVCTEHLNDEYAELTRQAIAAQCRKRPSPLARGQMQVWACGIVYALGQVNFLSDRSSEPCVTSAELCPLFDVAGSTAASKARFVRKALKMRHFDLTWTLPSQMANNPGVASPSESLSGTPDLCRRPPAAEPRAQVSHRVDRLRAVGHLAVRCQDADV